MSKPRASLNPERGLPFDGPPSKLVINGFVPYYSTPFGDAYLTDSLELLKALPDNSLDLVLTSPPYALHFKKEYGNVEKSDYVRWFLPFAREIIRALTPEGSFVLNIGGSYNKGVPTRSIYHYKLLISLVEETGFHLAQEFFWFNPAKLPMPAEWVTVRRVRVRDSVEHVWWLSKTPWPDADNRRVLKPYSADMIRLNQKGVRKAVRPSGHNIKSTFDKVEAGGSIPPNVIEDDAPVDLLRFGNNAANDLYTTLCKAENIKIHPARFPAALPDFFIKFLTKEKGLVFDPFAGSNTTGAVAESLRRRWIAADNVAAYLDGSKFRFSSLSSTGGT